MYICIYVCMYICMYVCIYVCVYVCMHACMYVYSGFILLFFYLRGDVGELSIFFLEANIYVKNRIILSVNQTGQVYQVRPDLYYFTKESNKNV